MYEHTAELHVRQEIAERVDRAGRRRLAARAREARRPRRRRTEIL